MLEFYWAYVDYKDLMKFTEKLFENLLKKIFGNLKIKYQGGEINFQSPWPRIEFSQILRKETKINLPEIHPEALRKEAEKLGIEVSGAEGKPELADKIYKRYCLPKIWQPTFVTNHPLGAFPLAKPIVKEQQSLANFQLVVSGWELINAFSELNDPIEQRRRFEEQEKFFKAGLEDAQRMDEDFIEALEHGMPPAAGFGMGIDRLVALLTDSHSLREVILFPTMRHR